MKRADLDTETVLRAVYRHRFQAYEHLCERYPKKVVLAAFEREVDRGNLEYGVSITRPWVTPHGKYLIQDPSPSPEAS